MMLNIIIKKINRLIIFNSLSFIFNLIYISSSIVFFLILFGTILILSDPSDDSYSKDTDENKDTSKKYHYCKICKKNV